ncbi:hypothetical protein J6590_035900 [Homalodisca vitripennis]|nr:hypothetical protein J6590_035900 [Homalodisca vitripennis]
MSRNNFVVTHQGLTVENILAELEDDDDDGVERLIYVVPPNEFGETDVDSDNSDDEHVGNINNLGRNLLLSECEVQTACSPDESILTVNSSCMSNVQRNDISTAGIETEREATAQDPQPSKLSINLVTSSELSKGIKKRPHKKLSMHCFNSDSEGSDNEPTRKKTKRNKNDREKHSSKKQLAAKVKEEKINQWKTSKPNFGMETNCEHLPCSDEAMESQTPFEFFHYFLITNC